MRLVKQLRSIGWYEWRLLLIFSFIIISCNWLSIGIMIIVPDVQFAQNGSNFSFNCDLLDFNSSVIFDHSQFDMTATEKYQLICDKEWNRNMAKSLYLLGFFFGCFGSGVVSDKFGRRPVMLVAPVIGCILSTVSIFAPNIEFYLFLRFLLGLFHQSLWPTSLILCTEMMTPDMRYFVELVDNVMFDVTMGLVGGASYLIKDFQHHHILTSAAYALCVLLVYFFTYESPRWLAATNRHDQCSNVVKAIASINGQPEERYHYLSNIPNETTKSNFLNILKTPLIRKRTLMLFFLWLGTVFSSYAIMFNLNTFTDDIRLGLVIMGAIGAPANFPILYITNRYGRQLCIFALWICSLLLLFGMAPLAHDKSSLILTALAVLGSVTIGGVFAILYLHTQELYPTVIRQTGMGACSTIGRVAALLSPQISALNAYWPPATVVSLGVVATLAAALVPALPDTTGVELAQTIHDGENFKRKHRYKIEIARRRASNDEESEANGELLKPRLSSNVKA